MDGNVILMGRGRGKGKGEKGVLSRGKRVVGGGGRGNIYKRGWVIYAPPFIFVRLCFILILSGNLDTICANMLLFLTSEPPAWNERTTGKDRGPPARPDHPSAGCSPFISSDIRFKP